MFLVDSLYYIEFETPNVEAMSAYYRNVLGMVETRNSSADKVMLGIDRDQPALVLRRADAARLGEIGFFVSGHREWHEIRSRLAARGIPYKQEVSESFGPSLCFDDCDGHPIRLYLRQEALALRHSPRLGPLLSRLQHVTYASPNPEKMAEFYVEVLNYKISDMVEGSHFIWLRTNMEHHTVAVAAGKHPGLDHMAFELPNWHSFQLWCDYLAMHNIDILWGPGRHGPGHNLFFFVLDPDGNRVEFSCELEKFEDEHMVYTPRVWKRSPKTVNLWGPGAPWPRELP